jgi:hypothetical protein
MHMIVDQTGDQRRTGKIHTLIAGLRLHLTDLGDRLNRSALDDHGMASRGRPTCSVNDPLGAENCPRHACHFIL